MKIKVLVENIAAGRLKAEWGLSYIVESDEKILFDTGSSELFLKNAEFFRENIQDIEKVVLSHGHWDHGTGLQYLKDKKLYAHPGIFKKRFHGKREIGLPFEENLFSKNNLEVIYSKEPVKVSENIIFLGQIPRITDFESRATVFTDDSDRKDFVEDDSCIAVVEKDKLNVISGCAHSGIVNTIEYAKKVTGVDDINLVVGGFHLQGNDQQTRKTIDYFKSVKINKVIPSHCNKFPALVYFYNEFKTEPLKVGDILEF